MAPYTHPDFAHWECELASARNKANGKPLQNNTRLFRRGEDMLAIRLHSTDVVTFYRDGTRRLASGGWETVTTLQRIRSYGSRHLGSSQGYWFVLAEEDPNDPHPLSLNAYPWERASRSIPKPYTVCDPGPEPVDDGVGCIAGTREEYIAGELDSVYKWQGEPKSWEFVTSRFYSDGSGPRRVVHRSFLTGNAYGASAHNSGWGVDYDKQVDVPTGWTYKQCPHCAAFRAKHEAWKRAYFGPAWGRGHGLGYQKMCEQLDMFGSREDWQAAYIEDFRTVRELNGRVKAWRERNLIPFYSGIEVTPEGLVPLKAKRKHCRKLEAVERERRRQERVHKRVRRQQAALDRRLERQRKLERQQRRQIAEALAVDLAAMMEAKRGEYPLWKRGEL